jgi:ribosomal protein S12 methylthiotransferase
VRAAELDHLGAFVYSVEHDTPSASLPDRPPRRTAAARRRRLLEAQRPIALRRRRELVGRTLRVLCEGVCDESEHLLQGRHHGMAPEVDGRLLINDGHALGGALGGAFVDVEITDAFAADLVGRIVGTGGEARVAAGEPRAGAATAPA